MKGSNFLKVTGILMIIGGAISIIGSVAALVALGALAAIGANAALLTATGIFALVGSVLQLVAGIVGVKNCANPHAAKKCMVWGVVVAAISVIGIIIAPLAGGEFSVMSLLLGLVLPALYIFGAYKNTQA